MTTRKLKRSRDTADFGDGDDDRVNGVFVSGGLSNGIGIGGGVYGFAADRTNNHDNKRQKLGSALRPNLAPTASSSEPTIATSSSSTSSSSAVSASGSGSGNSTLRDDNDWGAVSVNREVIAENGLVDGFDQAKRLAHTALYPGAVPSSLAHRASGTASGSIDSSPPRSSLSAHNHNASSPVSQPQTQPSGSSVGAFVHTPTRVRVRRSNYASPTGRTEDESSDDENPGGDVEDYDPDEVALDVGDASDSQRDEDEGEDDRDGKPTRGEQKQQQPLSGMNAFLHELHFAHRCQRPAPAPQPLVLSSPPPTTSKRHLAISTVHGSPSKPFTPSVSLSTASTSFGVAPPDPSIAEAARAAARRREALQKRNEAVAAKELASRASAVAIAQQRPTSDEEKSTVGAQYEETNRYAAFSQCSPVTANSRSFVVTHL